MDEEGRHPGERMEAPRQHSHRTQLLGGQGPRSRRRATVLPGKDGVHPGRAQKHLQRKGEARGEPVRVLCANLAMAANLQYLAHTIYYYNTRSTEEAISDRCEHNTVASQPQDSFRRQTRLGIHFVTPAWRSHDVQLYLIPQTIYTQAISNFFAPRLTLRKHISFCIY